MEETSATPSLPLTIADVAAALRSGDLTCVELMRWTLDRIAALDELCGAFLCRYEEQALESALAADGALRSGNDHGPLHGIPLAVKDLISTADGPTTAQSLVHDPTSVTGDGLAVARLRVAGMVVIGKTTTMEFGVGRHDPAKPFPEPRNPWNLDYSAGGSSSGSASAVATGMALAALGTDSGGSIRIPAAFSGVSGLKPTFGRVAKTGVVPLCYSLDHVGPTARSARDCALMLGVMACYDPADPSGVDRPVPAYTQALTGDLVGVRIGVDSLIRHSGRVDPALSERFEAAVAVLAELGADIIEVELPFYEDAQEVYMVTALGEGLAYHAPDLERRWDDYFAATRAIIGAGAFYTAADYVQAQRVRMVVQRAVGRLFREVDLVVTPTATIPAPRIDQLDEYFTPEGRRSLHTTYWNVVGNPAISVPMGFNADNLPFGLQLAGRPFDEAAVLRAGDAYQQVTEWHTQQPPLRAQASA